MTQAACAQRNPAPKTAQRATSQAQKHALMCVDIGLIKAKFSK